MSGSKFAAFVFLNARFIGSALLNPDVKIKSRNAKWMQPLFGLQVCLSPACFNATFAEEELF
jgi:hypothetical protein